MMSLGVQRIVVKHRPHQETGRQQVANERARTLGRVHLMGLLAAGRRSSSMNQVRSWSELREPNGRGRTDRVLRFGVTSVARAFKNDGHLEDARWTRTILGPLSLAQHSQDAIDHLSRLEVDEHVAGARHELEPRASSSVEDTFVDRFGAPGRNERVLLTVKE
jgi:hypothetical protein